MLVSILSHRARVARGRSQNLRNPLLGAALALVLSGTLLAGAPTSDAAASADRRRDRAEVAHAPAPFYTFVSMPDQLNADVADASGLPGYDGACGNSTSPDYEAAIRQILDEAASQNPDDVFVAGDLVQGHWSHDTSGCNYFQTTEPADLIRRAGALYYAAWQERFAARGLDVHAAVGDHDIGDDPWRRYGKNMRVRENWKQFQTYKATFAKWNVAPKGYVSHPDGQAAATAYAISLNPEVLLVTLDVFRRTDDEVIASVDSRQVRWLESVLAEAQSAGTDWVIVQGHTPILGPVRTRDSSALMLRNGADSGVWKLLVEYQVDLYLSGEVHDVTTRRDSGVTQISHGGPIGPLSSWITSRIHATSGVCGGSRMDIELTEYPDAYRYGTQNLWQTDPKKARPRGLDLGAPAQTGTLSVGANRKCFTGAGRLAKYTVNQ